MVIKISDIKFLIFSAHDVIVKMGLKISIILTSLKIIFTQKGMVM